MKKQLNIKKLILLNLPYILMGLFSTNFGEAWRMAVGADASAKMLSFFSTLPVALASMEEILDEQRVKSPGCGEFSDLLSIRTGQHGQCHTLIRRARVG